MGDSKISRESTSKSVPGQGLAPRPRAVPPRQRRALQTREQLIASARVIFARDGFEHARLEEIAAEAGKTRGAFYANFKDKEDVFFAIFEDDIARAHEELRPLLRGFTTIDERVDVLADYLMKLGRDRERTLLYLEFKVYAIRHPRKLKRLADLHAGMRLRCSLPEINELVPELELQGPAEKRSNSLAIGAITDGLAFNHLFDPEALGDAQLLRYLTLCVREFMHLETGPC